MLALAAWIIGTGGLGGGLVAAFGTLFVATEAAAQGILNGPVEPLTSLGQQAWSVTRGKILGPWPTAAAADHQLTNTCDAATFSALYAAQKLACSEKSSCSSAQGCTEIQQMIDNRLQCIQSRIAVMQTCYPGGAVGFGDIRHWNEVGTNLHGPASACAKPAPRVAPSLSTSLDAANMQSALRQELVRDVRKVFRDLPPLSDTDLLPAGFDAPVPGTEELAELRGCSRFELADRLEWLDPDVLYRMSGYARWYFAPTFLLLMLKHLEKYQFEGLLSTFAFSYLVLEEMRQPGWDMVRRVHDLTIDECLPATERRSSALNTDHFAVAASHFNGVERKLIVRFLVWAGQMLPEVPGINAAVSSFWDR